MAQPNGEPSGSLLMLTSELADFPRSFMPREERKGRTITSQSVLGSAIPGQERWQLSDYFLSAPYTPATLQVRKQLQDEALAGHRRCPGPSSQDIRHGKRFPWVPSRFKLTHTPPISIFEEPGFFDADSVLWFFNAFASSSEELPFHPPHPSFLLPEPPWSQGKDVLRWGAGAGMHLETTAVCPQTQSMSSPGDIGQPQKGKWPPPTSMRAKPVWSHQIQNPQAYIVPAKQICL